MPFNIDIGKTQNRWLKVKITSRVIHSTSICSTNYTIFTLWPSFNKSPSQYREVLRWNDPPEISRSLIGYDSWLHPSDSPLRAPDTGEHRALFSAKQLFISQVLECLEDFVLLTAGFVSFLRVFASYYLPRTNKISQGNFLYDSRFNFSQNPQPFLCNSLHLSSYNPGGGLFLWRSVIKGWETFKTLTAPLENQVSSKRKYLWV